MIEKVLITGGAGFLGYHLAKRLLQEGYAVHLVDSMERGVRDSALMELLESPFLELQDADCLDKTFCDSLGVDYSYIVHLAAIIGVVHVQRQPSRVLTANVGMTDNLLEVARRQRSLKRFLFPSTSEVYAGSLEAFAINVPTPEVTPLTVADMTVPRTSYMLSKIVGEFLCLHSEVPCTIFRPHNVYGPRMGLVHVIPGQLKKAFDARDGDVVEVPSTDQTRCFCFIDDALEQIVRMMLIAECEDQVLNLGTEAPEVTIGTVAALCHRAVGRSVIPQPMDPPPGSPARRAPDMTLTTRLTGYRSIVGLEEGVRRTYEWYLQNVFSRGGLTAL